MWLVLLVGLAASGSTARLHAGGSTARPHAGVSRLRAKPVLVEDVATFRRLLDEDMLQLGQLDVRGDTSVLREKDKSAHPVLVALRQRAAAGSQPGQRDDGMRIGLAIEGGGMRGAVGAGMVAALHELGFDDSFDAVYGSSAGALVGAYFISQQCLGNAGKAFINPIQLVRSVGLGALQLTQWVKNPRGLGPPALNLDYLLVDVMQRDRPLDWAAFWTRNEHTPLRVLASGLKTQKPFVMGSREECFNSLPELAHCLRASMLLPGITGPPIELSGRALEFVNEPLADAVLTEPVPYRAAIAEGCTHVLVLRTQPDGKRVSKKLSLGEALIAKRYFGRKFKNPKMLQHMLTQVPKRLYVEDILLLNEGANGQEVEVPIDKHFPTGNGQSAKGYLMPIALPEGSDEIGRLQTRPLPILKAIQRGFVAAYDLLSPDALDDPAGRSTGEEVVMRVFPDALVEPAI
ncbi:acyl transferase/acyl hydrolase/lysophospholipase [Pavlovales sp. CCMP2436]|nr:acyl transferase/acyl hydrolase/lysophospholipase [Pavlovales sp. CCMP2436]